MANNFSFSALGTFWNIELPKTKKSYKKEVKIIVDNFEKAYSRFLPASLISQLNNKGFINNPPQELIDILVYSKNLYLLSDGYFDISVGGTLESNGYGAKYIGKYKHQKDYYKQINISRTKITNNNIHIDLGGIGKGWLIDKISDYLKSQNVNEYIINGGGDILVNTAKPTKIYIKNPLYKDTYVGTVNICNMALASSSNIERQWVHNGIKHSHIINTKTNSYKNDTISTHIIAKNTVTADTLATAIFLANDKTILKLQKNINFEYMIIKKNGIIINSSGFKLQQI